MSYLRFTIHRKRLATGMRKRRPRSRTAYTLAAVLSLIAGDALAQGTTRYSPESNGQPEAALRPFYVNFNRFEIPFSVDQVGQRPVEVQLYVSRDAGAQWELYAAQAVSGKPFLFQADTDGNYWFATRTVDEQGNAAPLRPQLAVRVDTAQPRVQLQAGVTEQDLIKITLVSDDAAPSAEGIRVEYAIDQPQQWKPVADVVGRVEPGQSERMIASGEFLPATPWQHIWIRALVSDLAGNKTIVTEKVERPRVAATQVRLATSKSPATGTVPLAGSTPTVAAPATGVPMIGTPTVGGNEPVLSPAAPALSPWAVPQFSVSSGMMTLLPPNQTPSLPAVDPAAGPTGPALPPPLTVPSEPVPPPRPKTAAEAMRPLDASRSAAAPTVPLASVSRPSESVPAAAAPEPRGPADQPIVESHKATVPDAASGRPADWSTAMQPTGQMLDLQQAALAVRHSNSRKFSLEYEVESAGLAGLSEVELWGTTDFGQTWKRWGADPDRQSPFDIETNNDGTYGFRVVVVASNGLATPSPRDGEPADILISVDTEPPRVRISGATYGEAEQTGSLIIRYQCSDNHLVARPISLSFSSSPSGPWSTIAAGLENTGVYVWPADPTLPRQIYLRVDAVDVAGNTAHYVLDTPIDVQGLAPRARIRGFNPLTGSAGATRRISNEAVDQPSVPPLTATQPADRLK